MNWPLRIASLLVALTLIGCGPGTGGTGVGPVSMMGFSGSPTQAVWVVGPAAVSKSTCLGECDRADLRIEPLRVEFNTACRRFVAVGAWQADAFGRLTVNGTLETQTAAGLQSIKAQLALGFSEPDPADSTQVAFTLLDDKGNVLLGPTAIQRNDQQATGVPPACVPR